MQCGTEHIGWLSGWPDGTRFADGSLPPPVGAPPAAGTVCFEADPPRGGGPGGGLWACRTSAPTRAVSCGAFALWELPPTTANHCFGYCLAPDRCAECAAAGRCTPESWAGHPPGTCFNDDSTTDRRGQTCSTQTYFNGGAACGRYDDVDFTAATQCCGCGGAGAAFAPGHCACTAG